MHIVVKKITFANANNGFVIFQGQYNIDPNSKSSAKSDKETSFFLGQIPLLFEGEELDVEGSWIEHAKYGKQFKISQFVRRQISSQDGCIKFLASGLFRGIGMQTAQKIVEHFGERVLDILEADPKRISEIAGFRLERLQRFVEEWRSHKSSKEALSYLFQFGITGYMALKIYKFYGESTLQKIKDNPWAMVEDIHGITFHKADEIALKSGLDMGSWPRIRAGILHCLQMNVSQGHCYNEQYDLTLDTEKLLTQFYPMDISAQIELALNSMMTDESVKADGTKIYLPWIFVAEKKSASHLMDCLNQKPKGKIKGWLQKLSEFEKLREIEFSDQQKEAIDLATRSAVFILTGGPGTGKTTTLQGMLHLLKEANLKYLLAAPTGKAAKRMSEVCRVEAKTLHRLMEFDASSGQFQKNEENPLRADVIIVDEMSMVDILLFSSLMKAVSAKTSLIFMGDPDQLPSVGPGNVLADLLAVERISRIHLSRVYRQGKGSDIPQNAHRIIHGQMPTFESVGGTFHFRPITQVTETHQKLAEMISKHIPEHFGFHPQEDVQVLTPIHKGDYGTEQLNKLLQNALNPVGKPFKTPFGEYRIGDKVMQLKNNYDKNIFNGDTGYIISVDAVESTVQIRFDQLVTLDFVDLDQLSLAYACTIHKSQGSEYPLVVLVMDHSHRNMLQRNLFYTAVTRAKQRLIILSVPEIMQKAVNTENQKLRLSSLKDRLQDVSDFMDFLENTEN